MSTFTQAIIALGLGAILIDLIIIEQCFALIGQVC